MPQQRDSRGRFTSGNARSIAVTVDVSRLLGLMDHLSLRSREAVDEAAEAIRDLAGGLAAIDTGSLAMSVYISDSNESDYGQQAAAARSLNPDVVILPEIRPADIISLFGESDRAYVSVIGVAAGHGIFNEIGTRFMSPHPFMFPAVEIARELFASDMSNVADGF